MVVKSQITIDLENMEIGEVKNFPRDMKDKIRRTTERLYCHGKSYTVRCGRKDEFVVVKRFE